MVSRKLIYRCENITEILNSGHFKDILDAMRVSENVHRILNKIGDGSKLSKDEKVEIGSFLESDETRLNGRVALRFADFFRHNAPTSDYVIKILGNDGIDLLLSDIAEKVNIKLFKERNSKLYKLRFPKIPETWVGNEKLEARYFSLMKIALENEEWWLKMKGKIKISPDSITINGIKIPLNCIEEKITGTEYMMKKAFEELARPFKEYEAIYNFIVESIELGIDKKTLMGILGISEELYLLKDEGESDRFARGFNFDNGTKTMLMSIKTGFSALHERITN